MQIQVVATSVYFDDNHNVIIIPIIREESGVGYDSMKFIKLQNNFSIQELSESIINSLKTSQLNDLKNYKKYNVWTEASGIKSFSSFSKKYKLVTISYRTDRDTYDVTKEKRFKDGSYGLDREDVAKRVKTYPGRPSVETIGEQVLEALKIE